MTDTEKIAAIRDYINGRAAEISAQLFPVWPRDIKVDAAAILEILDRD